MIDIHEITNEIWQAQLEYQDKLEHILHGLAVKKTEVIIAIGLDQRFHTNATLIADGGALWLKVGNTVEELYAYSINSVDSTNGKLRLFLKP